MSLKNYIRDKLYLIISSIVTDILITFFLFAVKTNRAAILMVNALFWILIISILIKEYTRRKEYYADLESTMEALDQKYLITELLKEPEFLDGKLLFQTLRDVDKSMCDHVNFYKNKQLDYKEYIEMWVHEIKTPLAASKLIISNNKNEVTASIDEELDKLDDFVEQALYYARSAALEKDYLIREINLAPLINKIIRKHAKSFIYKNIRADLHDIDTIVYTDIKWMEFILNQIIENSLKYIRHDHGTIHIYTHQQKNSVQLYIQDNGIGIRDSELPRIFDKGFTGSNGRTNEKATGMGLYLCKTLCEKLHLDIQAKSHDGTTIIITFPINKQLLFQ